MSVIVALPPPARLTCAEWLTGLVALAIGRVLLAATSARPARLRRALERLARDRRPASLAQARRADQVITTLSLRCAAGQHCLTRSVAVAIFCRLHGCWPTWRSGVRYPPLAAHAWVEAEGHPVGEPPGVTATFTPVITISSGIRS